MRLEQGESCCFFVMRGEAGEVDLRSGRKSIWVQGRPSPLARWLECFRQL